MYPPIVLPLAFKFLHVIVPSAVIVVLVDASVNLSPEIFKPPLAVIFMVSAIASMQLFSAPVSVLVIYALRA